MLQHKQLAGALTFDPIQWLDIPPKDLQIFCSYLENRDKCMPWGCGP